MQWVRRFAASLSLAASLPSLSLAVARCPRCLSLSVADNVWSMQMIPSVSCSMAHRGKGFVTTLLFLMATYLVKAGFWCAAAILSCASDCLDCCDCSDCSLRCAGSPKTTVIVLQDATGSQHSNFYGKRGFSKCKKKAGGQVELKCGDETWFVSENTVTHHATPQS